MHICDNRVISILQLKIKVRIYATINMLFSYTAHIIDVQVLSA